MLILIIFSGTTVSYAGCAKSVNLGADYKEKRQVSLRSKLKKTNE